MLWPLFGLAEVLARDVSGPRSQPTNETIEWLMIEIQVDGD